MLIQIKIIIFIIISAVIMYVSRRSLTNFRTHGFYRFFAWEAILIITMLNIDYWIYEPQSIHQIISWCLLVISIFLVIHGFKLLINIGRPGDERADPSLITVEKTTKLVKVGAYKYIRHPLYGSLLFLDWGVFFKHLSWIAFCLAVLATFFLIMTAKMEEAENISFFGNDYREYMKRTKMFFPFLL
jgi:protein-S-isoprenylcysteine O-methyltransferase Ste14